MGWFDFIFKKPKVNQEINIIHDIVCPYCFERFKHFKVHFRVENLEGEYKARTDDKLDQYRQKFGMDAAGDMPPFIIPKEDEIIKDKLLYEITDKNGKKTRKRLCPYCHNDLHVSAGKYESNIISIVGAPRVGKSVYIASLIHTLQNSTAGNFDAACIPLNNEISNRFESDYETPIFDRGVLLASTNKVRQEPLIFEFVFKDNSKAPLTLVFFDIAGEDSTDESSLNSYASHIKNSAGLIFMVDPLQIRMIREKFIFKLGDEAGDIASKYVSPRDVANSLRNDFRTEKREEKVNIPTAVVITKSDLLHALKDEDGEYIKPNSNIFNNYVHKGTFNLSESNNINQEVGKFLQKVDRNFKNIMDDIFKPTEYFAVSALGSNPVNQQLDGVASPIRVDEPFLWLLYKLGYIEGREG
jgi:GTPase SAR1 family protein